MQKIIIIDDNTVRQEDEYIGEPLEDYSDVLYNAIEEKYVDVHKELKQNKVNSLSFEIIIVHESAFDKNEEVFDLLQDYCKEFNKKLIYFSGGIPAVSYGSTTDIIYIPSKILYKNLVNFLEDENLNIKILAYGKNWKINVLNSVLKEIKKLYRELALNSKVRTKTFRKKVGFDMLEDMISPLSVIEKDFLELEDIDRIIFAIKNEMDF